MRKTRERADERLERSKLREFYDGVIEPQLKWEGASKSHIERHDAAVEYAERFSKSPLSPAAVDDQFILNFDAWLWRQGISDGRRRDIVESLRRIVAVWTPDPEKIRTNRSQRRPLPDPAPGSLRDYYERFYVTLQLIGRTAKYIDENRAVMRSFYEHYGRDVQLSEFGSDALLADHVGWLLEKGMRPATINKYLAVIRAVLNHARKRGVVDRVPAVQTLPVETDVNDSWTPEQVAAFIDACPAAAAVVSQDRLGGIVPGDWWEALVRIVWYSGLRRRALLAIRRTPPEVDLQSGWLRTPGSSQKNRKGQPFRLGVDALEAIGRIWNPSRPLLLPYGYAQKNEFYIAFHHIREAAGLPPGRKHLGCLHILRRSSATELYLRRGIGAAQTLLGHSSPQLTMRHYVDPTRVPAHDFTDALQPLKTRKRATDDAAAAG